MYTCEVPFNANLKLNDGLLFVLSAICMAVAGINGTRSTPNHLPLEATINEVLAHIENSALVTVHFGADYSFVYSRATGATLLQIFKTYPIV